MDCGGGAASNKVVVIGLQMEWALSATLAQGAVCCSINNLIGKVCCPVQDIVSSVKLEDARNECECVSFG